jgi:hypothetical protein
LCSRGISVRTKIYGIEGIPQCGQIPEVLARHRLDAASIVERILTDA